jgi:spermidine synthase
MPTSWRLYGLFFLSGLSALIYEIVWQRMLNLVFGVSTLSVSTVLAGFMGGLALGGFLFSTAADQARRPLRLYAWLEAGIAVTGLLVPAVLGLFTGLYTVLHQTVEPGPFTDALLRFAGAVLVLGIPATLMGATLPVMGRLALREQGELATTFSVLYAANTLGAVLGAALTGFFLLRLLGMQVTLWVAAGVNLLVAASACWMREPESFFGVREKDASSTSSSSAVPLLLAALTGFSSMIFEVGWARILGILTSNSAYGFALILTVMLLGLGLGSLIQGWRRLGHADPWRWLALCQWLLAGVTMIALPFFHVAPDWLDRWCDGNSAGAIFLGELLLTAGALFVPAVLMGMSLPLLVAGTVHNSARFGVSLGRIYSVNTLGCVAGALAAGFVLIPWLGIQNTMGLLIALALTVAVCAWRRATLPARSWRWAALAVALTALAGWQWLPPGVYLKSALLPSRHLLFYQEGNNATVSVVEEDDGARSIMVDSQPVAGTVGTSVVDQKMLAHLPLLLHPAPQRALTIGFGSGGTSYSMSLHGIEVDCVEIEARVPAAARFFASENHGILSRPRYRLIIDDARSSLRVARLQYDVIATDCTNIQYRSNGDLYTVDYFRLMKDRLTANGLAAAWVPANGIAERDLRTLLRSFQEVFPHTSVWYMNSLPTDFLIVIGTPGRLAIDLEALGRRMREPAVASDLVAAGYSNPFRLVYSFLVGEEALGRYVAKAELNTDDRPILSYSTYGAAFRSTIAGNLAKLLTCREDVASLSRPPALRLTMLRHYAASNELLLGHIAHLAGADEASAAHYRNAAQLLPDDPAVHHLMQRFCGLPDGPLSPGSPPSPPQ